MRALIVLLVAWTAIAACDPPHRFADFTPPPDPNVDAPRLDAPLDAFVPEEHTTHHIGPGLGSYGDRIGTDLAHPGEQLAVDSLPYHRAWTNGYAITKYCVTDAWYGECVAAGQCPAVADFSMIEQADAAVFCSSMGMRLPTEAELDRAIRGDDGGDTLAGPIALEPACAAQWVYDGYACDNYVNRSYKNPHNGGVPYVRTFSPVGPRVVAPLMPRGFHCVAEDAPTDGPAEPLQPPCVGAGCTANAIALGERFGCAVHGLDSHVDCWGLNVHGELGTGDRIDAIPATKAHTVVLPGKAEQVAAGTNFACARIMNGDVYCWGAGELTPIKILGNTANLVAAGDRICVETGGTVACWSPGASPLDVGVPVVFRTLAMAPAATCVVTSETTLACWGTIYDATGAQVTLAPVNRRTITTTRIAGVAVADDHVCYASGDSPAIEVYCWGDRAAWGPGTGITGTPELVITKSAPSIFVTHGATIVTDGNAIVLDSATRLPGNLVATYSVAFAGASTCAITGAGAYCQGVDRGQLGTQAGCDPTPVASSVQLH